MNRFLAVAALIALAGCGSGSGKSDTSPGTQPASTPSSSAVAASNPANSTAPTTALESTTTATAPVTTTIQPSGSDALPVPLAQSVLNVGDCYNIGTDNVVVMVSCDELHVGQVFESDIALTGIEPTDPNPDNWLFATTVACRDALETFTGAPLGTVDFTVAALVTSPADAPTVISCTAVKADGAQWVGTAERIKGAYAGIDVGDCFDFPTATSPSAHELPCNGPHEAEMYVVDTPLVPDQLAPYPTLTEWAALAQMICNAPFAAYTGQSINKATDLSYAYLYTLDQDWANVSLRQMSCAVVNHDGTRLVGSVRA